MQALAVKLGYPKDRAGNAYVATEKQICSKDKKNFVSEFKQKGKGITISLLLKDKETGKDYSTAITLYPIQAAKDWAVVNPKAAASPAKLPARNDNSYIVFDASSPDITPREWLANYLAAAKGNFCITTRNFWRGVKLQRHRSRN